MIRIPGLSSARVSDEIPMPDIGQLLLEPFFFDTDINSAYENGSEFQRLLIDSIPDLGAYGHNVISVMCEVRLMAPDYRACTMPNEDDMHEWHIDDESGIDGESEYVWAEEADRVHLYTNQTSAMTQFLKDDLIIPDKSTDNMCFDSFMEYFQDYYQSNNPEVVSMPANRIVTFTNQLHRATNPKNYEFRYIFRVTETNRTRAAGPYDPNYQQSTVFDINQNESVNVAREGNEIRIVIPGEGLQMPGAARWERKTLSQPEIPAIQTQPEIEEDDPFTVLEDDTPIPEPVPSEYVRGGVSPNPLSDFLESNREPTKRLSNPKEPFKEMHVEDLSWEAEKMSGSAALQKFAPKNSVAVICYGMFDATAANNHLLEFFQKLPKQAHLEDDEGNQIKGAFKYDYYDFDTKLGKIAGAFFIISPTSKDKVIPGAEYKLVTDTSKEYKYIVPDDLRVTIPETYKP